MSFLNQSHDYELEFNFYTITILPRKSLWPTTRISDYIKAV